MDPFHDLDRNVPMYNSMLHEQQAWQAECEQKLNEDPQSDGAKPPSMATRIPPMQRLTSFAPSVKKLSLAARRRERFRAILPRSFSSLI